MAPDLKKKVDAARAARLARENMTAEQLQAQVSSPRTLQTPFVNIYHLSAAERLRFSKARVVKFPTTRVIVSLPPRIIWHDLQPVRV